MDGIDDKLSTISNEDDRRHLVPALQIHEHLRRRYDFRLAGELWRRQSLQLSRNPPDPDGRLCSQRRRLCEELRGSWCGRKLLRQLYRSDRQARDGILRPGFPELLLLHGIAVCVSDRWFSPVSTKSIGNRIATFTGGTTQGLVRDPGNDDHLPQLDIPNIFQELDQAKVSWKIYYTVTEGFCLNEDDCTGFSERRISCDRLSPT